MAPGSILLAFSWRADFATNARHFAFVPRERHGGGPRLATRARSLVTSRHLGQPEIEHLRVPSLRHEDVGRLNVAVNDTCAMGGIKRVSDLDGQRKQRLDFHRTFSDHVLECRSVQKLHRDEGAPVLLANVMNRADVGVAQGRRCLRASRSPSPRRTCWGYQNPKSTKGSTPVRTGGSPTHASILILRGSTLGRSARENSQSPNRLQNQRRSKRGDSAGFARC
jgi:hypothetical protein